MGNVVLVTGSSAGLGVAISVQAAAAGDIVYASMRNTTRRAELDEAAAGAGVDLAVVELDVQDTASVDAAVAEIIAKEGRIDVLVNNAGSGFARSTEQATMEDIAWIMDVNFMGVVRTTKAVLPHMRVARSGRVINISSVGGLVGQPFNEIYCASKFALEGYTESLASYVTPGFGIHFTAVEPGGISSAFAAAAMSHIQSTGGLIDDEYLPLLQRYIGSSSKRGAEVFQTPSEVAAVVIDVMTADQPPIRLRTSEWSRDLCQLKTAADPDGSLLQAKVIDMFLPE